MTRSNVLWIWFAAVALMAVAGFALGASATIGTGGILLALCLVPAAIILKLWPAAQSSGEENGSRTSLSESVTTMPMIFSRTAIIPVWLVVLALFAVSGSPITSAAGLVMLLVAGIALTIFLARWNEPRPTMAAVKMPDPPLARPPSTTAFVPNSWPNSGFRNTRQKGTRSK